MWALKEEGLAFSLCAGVEDEEHTTNSAHFSITVDLTPTGLQSVDRVVELVLGGVGSFARAPQEQWMYDELRDISSMRFEFAESEPEIDYVRRLAISLQHGFDPPQTLSADYLVQDYDPTVVSELLGRLTPERLIVTLSHKPTADEPRAPAP